jgi:hypothetical protein
MCFIYVSKFIIIYLNIDIKPRAKINTNLERSSMQFPNNEPTAIYRML